MPIEKLKQFRGNRIRHDISGSDDDAKSRSRIETQMIKAIQAHDQDIGRLEARQRSRDALGLVGISSPEERPRAYPRTIFWWNEITCLYRDCNVEQTRSYYCR